MAGPGSRRRPRRAGRRTNVGLLLFLVLALVSGVLAFAVGSLPAATVTAVAHGALGLALVALIPWKQVVVRRAHVAGRRRLAALALLLLVPLAVLSGVAHTVAGYRIVGGITALQVHVGAALALLPFLVAHVVAHPQWPRRTDLSRRGLLRLAGLGAGAAAAYVLVEGASAVTGSRAAATRATGSTEIGSGTPSTMPVTQWIGDRVPATSAASLTVAGRRVDVADLDRGDEVTAVLDCTGGWYAEQTWSGVRLDRLLGALPDGGSIEVVSVTGYRRRLPLGDADRLWLAVRCAGAPLSTGHGAPARLVAPGRRGFWWVKWVTEVRLSDAPWWRQPPFPLQ